MFAFLILVCSSLAVSSLCSSTFKTSPDYVIYMNKALSGSAIKISDDQKYVMIGFQDGDVKVYSTQGSYYCTCNGHYNPIIDIQYVRSIGWITLDSSGKAIRWSTSCSYQYGWNFLSTVYDMSVTSDSSYSYVGFNFGISVVQYYANTNNDFVLRRYLPSSSNIQFKRIQYGPNHNFLYVETNSYYLQQYSCSSGYYTYYSYYISYPSLALDTTSNGYVILMNYYYFFRFNNLTNVNKVSYTNRGNLMAASYKDFSTVYVSSDSNGVITKNLFVYDNYGTLTQNLTFPVSTIKAIDTSSKYLCSVDSYGYLYINSFQINQSSGGGGVVGGIIGGVILFMCIAGIIMKIVRDKRKQRQAQSNNTYQRFNNQPVSGPISPPYYPNNQPFSPQIIPNSVSNQGFNPHQNYQPIIPYNPNQPFIGNQAPNPVYTNPQSHPQNPYQLNQPSNWS